MSSKLLTPIDRFVAHIPEFVVNIAMRLIIFKIFWLSVQAKIVGATFAGQHFAFWNIKKTAFLLFDFEYNVPLIPSSMATYIVTFAEFFFSLFILFGLFTRLSAFSLLIMTLIIQVYVHPQLWWSVHVFWIVIFMYIMKYGGGTVSLDNLLFNKR